MKEFCRAIISATTKEEATKASKIAVFCSTFIAFFEMDGNEKFLEWVKDSVR